MDAEYCPSSDVWALAGCPLPCAHVLPCVLQFAGFSADALCERILDSQCSLLITAGEWSGACKTKIIIKTTPVCTAAVGSSLSERYCKIVQEVKILFIEISFVLPK